jgi:hypothetical protein
MDVVNSLWGALPIHRQTREPGKRTSPQEKVMDLADHFDDIDWAQAFENMVNNQVEDLAFGYAGRKVAEGNRVAGFSFGFGTGPGL